MKSTSEDINVNLLIKENPLLFHKYSKKITNKIKKVKKKVVVSLSSKNMDDVFESIFIN